MDNGIFRKKSMDKISSPEQLNEYIHVTNPGVWIILCAIIILLAGFCVWGIFGKMDTKITVSALSKDGKVYCLVKENEINSVKTDMPVIVDGKEYKISEISSKPVAVGDEIEDYAKHLGNLQNGEWVYVASVEGNLQEGIYSAEIVVDSVSPIKFVTN